MSCLACKFVSVLQCLSLLPKAFKSFCSRYSGKKFNVMILLEHLSPPPPKKTSEEEDLQGMLKLYLFLFLCKYMD